MIAATLKSLAEKVKAAPSLNADRIRWVDLFPYVEQLREKGYRYEDAVAFMVEAGAIEPGEESKAKNAFECIKVRRNKKAKAK